MITYQEISRQNTRNGVDMTVLLTDSETGLERTKTIFFARQNPSESSVTACLNHCINHFEFDCNPLNALEINDIDVKNVLEKLVTYIRNNSDVTFSQLTTVVDNQFPNLPWKPEKILLKLQDYLEERLKVSFDFSQFKTYIINHKFCGVDE